MSSPYHPATNGQAERFVQTFKRALQKSSKTPEEALLEFLLYYRRTPGDDGFSPSERLNGRQIRTHIDTYHPTPTKVSPENFTLPLQYSFIKAGSQCYVKNELRKGDRTPKWLPAIIQEILGRRHVLVKFMHSDKVVKGHMEQLRPRYTEAEETDFPLYLPTWNNANEREDSKLVQPETPEPLIPKAIYTSSTATGSIRIGSVEEKAEKIQEGKMLNTNSTY
ncbi:hypothetical protein RF11_14651 [Thelohanellus kitauei]|uniref:Integrase catalytic domain-containing protein n=1 Tax=Thelohanellus kitauei TaxID=669202 RepID=A0A0C2MAL7_THEKT|nr:hypothetical protein RF11_14651 [Thelohanellus kitauei]